MKTIRLADLEYEQDYLVYDAFYPLNSLDTPYHIEDYACESSMLYNLSNLVVRVEIHNGECYLSRVCYSNKPYEWDWNQFDKDKRQLKSAQDSMLVSALNQRIKEENYLWVAGFTSVSELYYDQRKDMLPKNFKVTVTPNPASSQVTVEYILPEGSSRATLTVVNTLGENMTELGLEGNRGSRVVDLHELPAGVYFFVVTDQSGRTSSSKLMIINH